MAIRFVLDEHLRGSPLWHAIQQHNRTAVVPLDATRVGDPPDLPLSTPDQVLLSWAEREGRILITLDRSTMPRHLNQHLLAGHHCPGIFTIRAGSTVPQVVAFLEAVVIADAP